MIYFGMTCLGVVGLRGLGHMAVKFGKAFGLHVIVIITSLMKENEAKEILGAYNFLISRNENQMKEAAKALDYIIDMVSVILIRIPPAFFKNIRKEDMNLEGPSGHKWIVKLWHGGTKMEFRPGWESFVCDHEITLGEFLVFKRPFAEAERKKALEDAKSFTSNKPFCLLLMKPSN
ncbi:hypothetical protein KI387_030737, partial [Taxus chinensis]